MRWFIYIVGGFAIFLMVINAINEDAKKEDAAFCAKRPDLEKQKCLDYRAHIRQVAARGHW